VAIVTQFVTQARDDDAERPERGLDLALFEEVFIDTLDHIHLLILHANVVTDHQAAQSRTIDQDDPGGHPVCVRHGLWRETARGDEDAPVRLGAMEGPTNSWISGRPTGRFTPYRLAWT
jgi:hypothetical protein